MDIKIPAFYTNLTEATGFIKDICKSEMLTNIVFQNRDFNTLDAHDAFKMEINLKDKSILKISISQLRSDLTFYNVSLYTKNGHCLTHINNDFHKSDTPEDYIQFKKVIISLFKQYMMESL